MRRGFVLSYQRSITTQNFLNILYWFEERRNTTNKGDLSYRDD